MPEGTRMPPLVDTELVAGSSTQMESADPGSSSAESGMVYWRTRLAGSQPPRETRVAEL